MPKKYKNKAQTQVLFQQKCHCAFMCYLNIKLSTFSLMYYLVKKGRAVRGVFGECRGPTHYGFVHAIVVIRHAHAPLVQVRLLLQQGAWVQNAEGKLIKTFGKNTQILSKIIYLKHFFVFVFFNLHRILMYTRRTYVGN